MRNFPLEASALIPQATQKLATEKEAAEKMAKDGLPVRRTGPSTDADRAHLEALLLDICTTQADYVFRYQEKREKLIDLNHQNRGLHEQELSDCSENIDREATTLIKLVRSYRLFFLGASPRAAESAISFQPFLHWLSHHRPTEQQAFQQAVSAYIAAEARE